MANAAFEKLTVMWHSGEIDDEEFKLATKYLKEEQAKAGSTSRQNRQPTKPGLSGWLLEKMVGHSALARWPAWKRSLAEFGVFLSLGLTLFAIAAFGGTSLLVASLDWKINPVIAALLTFLLLAAGGSLVRYDGKVMSIVAVPLFLGILLAPMWGGDGQSVSRSTASTKGAWYGRAVAVRQMWACRTEEAYDRSVSRAAEGRKREAEAEPGCMAFSPGQEAYVLPGGFMDGIKELTRFEVTGSAGETYEFVTGKDAFRKK